MASFSFKRGHDPIIRQKAGEGMEAGEDARPGYTHLSWSGRANPVSVFTSRILPIELHSIPMRIFTCNIQSSTLQLPLPYVQKLTVGIKHRVPFVQFVCCVVFHIHHLYNGDSQLPVL